jgi:hypothetical protein
MRTDSAPVPPVIVFQNLRLSFDLETAEFIVVNESILE